MKFKIIILFMLLLILPPSCMPKAIKFKYPVNSKWKYYDGKDTITVYISHYTMSKKRIMIQDTLSDKHVDRFGWVNPDDLIPID